MLRGDDLVLLTAGADPGGRAHAPGSLRLVQALVNTLNAHTGKDLLAGAVSSTSWPPTRRAGFACAAPTTIPSHG